MAGSAGGSRKLLVLVLVGCLVGFVTWNYRRNAAADAAVPRPFRSHSDADLEALGAAYRQELEAAVRRFEAASGTTVKVAEGRLLDDQVRQFERVQRRSRSVRELAARMREHEASLEGIEEEQRLREAERPAWLHLLKQAFVYRG